MSRRTPYTCLTCWCRRHERVVVDRDFCSVCATPTPLALLQARHTIAVGGTRLELRRATLIMALNR